MSDHRGGRAARREEGRRVVRRRHASLGVRLLAAAVVLVLGAGVAWAAWRALQPASAPAAPATSPRSGVVASTAADAVWRAVNGPPCGQPGTPDVPIERLQADGSWLGAPSGLLRVDALAFAGSSGVAVGLDSSCSSAYAVSSDGGASWQAGSPARPLVSAAFGGEVLWALATGSDGRAGLLLLSASAAGSDTSIEVPCSQGDGAPSLVEAVDATYGWGLCQGPRGEGRLLLRTTTAGKYWDRLTDARPLTGFDLLGRIRSLDFVSRDQGWALGDDPACPEGQVRTTTDSGLTWHTLPCPALAASLDTVLSVAFSSATDGVLLGLSEGEAVVLTTSDAGRSWTLPE